MDYKELKELRTSLGYTQKEFCKEIGLSRAKYQFYEGGHDPIPLKIKNAIKNFQRLKFGTSNLEYIMVEGDYILKIINGKVFEVLNKYSENIKCEFKMNLPDNIKKIYDGSFSADFKFITKLKKYEGVSEILQENINLTQIFRSIIFIFESFKENNTFPKKYSNQYLICN